MSLADALQTISLVAVAITIGLSALQNRHAARQTREIARQSTLAQNALAQAVYHQTIVGQGSTYVTNLLTNEPELLAWFLRSRGFPPATAEINKRYMLLFLRLEVHEASYLAHLDGTLPDDVWLAWHRVIELDAATVEFGVVWPVVRAMYSARFVAFLEGLTRIPAPRRAA